MTNPGEMTPACGGKLQRSIKLLARADEVIE
jgi:hypothetical protein